MPDAFLLDLDGTLYSGGAPVPGAVAAVAALHERGIPFRFLTNTTSRSRAGIVRKLHAYGFAIAPSHIQTPVVVATALARAEGLTTIVPFVAEEALEDLAGFELRGGGVEAADMPFTLVPPRPPLPPFLSETWARNGPLL